MRLQSALWAGSSPAYKDSLGCSPFCVVYDLEAVVLMVFMVSSLQIAVKERLDEKERVRARKEILLQLDEQGQLSELQNEVQQAQRIGWVNCHRKKREKDLIPGAAVLVFQS